MKNAIIVFGAHGFIGHHLVRTLMAQGYPVMALSRRGTPALPGAELHVGPFDTPEQFAPLLSHAHAIVHAASCSTPGTTAGQPLAELAMNLRPTLALLEALQAAPHCQLLYISSGGTLYGDTPDCPAHETSPLCPRSYYGAGKAAAEHFIQAAAQQFNLAATILRPSNLYGPGQGVRGGFGIIPAALAHAQSGAPLTLWGDGSTVRDYLYIDDFIRVCSDIIDQSMPSGTRIFNLASGDCLSLVALIDLIRRVTGRALSTHHDLGRPVDVARIELDTQKIRQTYGWQARVSLEEGLNRTWRWWQERSA